MAATLEFEFRGRDSRRREDRSTRLLLIGDFGARAHRGLADPAALIRRPVSVVDVDSLDDSTPVQVPSPHDERPSIRKPVRLRHVRKSGV